LGLGAGGPLKKEKRAARMRGGLTVGAGLFSCSVWLGVGVFAVPNKGGLSCVLFRFLCPEWEVRTGRVETATGGAGWGVMLKAGRKGDTQSSKALKHKEKIVVKSDNRRKKQSGRQCSGVIWIRQLSVAETGDVKTGGESGTPTGIRGGLVILESKVVPSSASANSQFVGYDPVKRRP